MTKIQKRLNYTCEGVKCFLPLKNNRLARLLALAVCTGFFVLTALKTPAQPAPQITLSFSNQPPTFNPVFNSQYPNFFDLIFVGLTSENPLTGLSEPDLAESWEISPDKRRYIFTLRDKLQWSDGHPLTAEDVIFTYKEVYFNQKIPTDLRDIFYIGSKRILPQVRQLDQRRVEFVLPQTFAPFLRTTSAPILPAHILQKSVRTVGKNGDLQFLSMWGINTPAQQLIVNGPYRLESYQFGGDDTSSSTAKLELERLIFRRNSEYWRKDKNGNSLPQIERVVWQYVPSHEAALSLFNADELDSISVFPEDLAKLELQQTSGRFKIYQAANNGTSFLSFNLNQGNRNKTPLVEPTKSRWFNNKQFRLAISCAINRPAMIKTIFHGLAKEIDSNISVNSPYYLSPEKDFAGCLSFDPEKAKNLLLAAGFNYNTQGELQDKNGQKVQFNLLVNSGENKRQEMASLIQKDLSKIGIEVKVNTVGFNQLIQKIAGSLDWEAVILGFSGSAEPHDGINIWLPDGNLHLFNQFPGAGYETVKDWVVADWERQIGDLYLKGSAELDEQKRRAIYHQAQRLVRENYPFIYLVNPLSMTAVKERIRGIKYSANAGAFWNIYDLTIED